MSGSGSTMYLLRHNFPSPSSSDSSEADVRNPSRPELTPRMGVLLPAVLRATCSTVPSPPTTTIKSHKRATSTRFGKVMPSTPVAFTVV